MKCYSISTKMAFSVVILLFEISVIFTVKSEKVIGTLGTKYPPPARVTHWITDRLNTVGIYNPVIYLWLLSKTCLFDTSPLSTWFPGVDWSQLPWVAYLNVVHEFSTWWQTIMWNQNFVVSTNVENDGRHNYSVKEYNFIWARSTRKARLQRLTIEKPGTKRVLRDWRTSTKMERRQWVPTTAVFLFKEITRMQHTPLLL